MKRLYPAALMASLWVGSVWSASLEDLQHSIDQLARQAPAIQGMAINQQRTRNKAYVLEEAGKVTLTIDPYFLEESEPSTVMFVLAHEYAHVALGHDTKMAEKARELSGLDDEEKAFEAVVRDPVKMEKMHSQNRQFELEADKLAVQWLTALEQPSCTKSILATFQSGGMFQPMAPTHPPFSARQAVVCDHREAG